MSDFLKEQREIADQEIINRIYNNIKKHIKEKSKEGEISCILQCNNQNIIRNTKYIMNKVCTGDLEGLRWVFDKNLLYIFWDNVKYDKEKANAMSDSENEENSDDEFENV